MRRSVATLLAAATAAAAPAQAPAQDSSEASRGGSCMAGVRCEPDPRSCMGKGSNTVWGYHVTNAPNASWNGDYSPGSPLVYMDNVLRYDLNGDKLAGHSLYRFAGQWRLAHVDVYGYASGPFGTRADSRNWKEYGKEQLMPIIVSRTTIETQIPGWTSGVACVQTNAALAHFFQRADAEHKWVVAALWRNDCAECDRIWKPLTTAESELHRDTFFLAVDVDRCYEFMQNQPVLSELPVFLLFGTDFKKKLVLSTADIDDVLGCLRSWRRGMQCQAAVAAAGHGDVWEEGLHDRDRTELNPDYQLYTPNLVQDVAYSLSGGVQTLVQLGANDAGGAPAAPSSGGGAALAARGNGSAALPPLDAPRGEALLRLIVEAVAALHAERGRAEHVRAVRAARAAPRRARLLRGPAESAARALQPAPDAAMEADREAGHPDPPPPAPPPSPDSLTHRWM